MPFSSKILWVSIPMVPWFWYSKLQENYFTEAFTSLSLMSWTSSAKVWTWVEWATQWRRALWKQEGDPVYLRKALVNNLGEETRTRLHIQKLQRALNIQFREIDREKACLRNFGGKLHKKTGYFPRQPFWWSVPL